MNRQCLNIVKLYSRRRCAVLFTIPALLFLCSPHPTYAATTGQLKTVAITDINGSNIPPTAVINYTESGGTYTFDGTASSDSDGSIVEYQWDFGDGTTASGSITNHEFAGDLTPVSLTIVDDKGGVTISQTEISTSIQSFEVIIDDKDSSFTKSGNWRDSTWTPGYYNISYQAVSNTDISSEAIWTTDLPYTGTYEILCQYTSGDNRATNAPFTIINNGNTINTIAVNQRINGGSFISLGKFSLTIGSLQISLTNLSTDGYVIADAIKIVLSSP